MNIKKKLSVLLVLCVVMVGHAHQDMSLTQAPVAVPQEEDAIAVQTQRRVDQTKKSKRRVKKQPSKQREMSPRGKRILKGVGGLVSAIVGIFTFVALYLAAFV